MFSAALTLIGRLGPGKAIGPRHAAMFGLLLALHATALVVMAATEADLVARTAFLLVWLLLNFFWLGVLRRPVGAALVSLAIVVVLILLSRFKHDKLWITVDFVDLLIIDKDTSSFLLMALPSLRLPIVVSAIITVAAVAVAWRLDPVRSRLLTSAAGSGVTTLTLVALSLIFPTDLDEDFFSRNYVSKFARTGVEALYERYTRGYLESDASAYGSLNATPATACLPVRRLPHIILLHDESSFDVTAAPGMRVPPDYHHHFQSFDGSARKLVVEGAGGPSWFTEYNVLTGLSVRSYGRFATSATRIAAGRIEHGLPHSLRRCGYKTFSLYPFYGAFLGSRAFHTSAGIEHYLDMRDLGTRNFEADSFYFDQAVKIIHREHDTGPLFLYVYTVANHFPWDTRLFPGLMPDWRAPGNAANIDEYIRRQAMTAHDYRALLERLTLEFPNEPFLIVRYGDHQPDFGRHVIDPSVSQETLARRLKAFDRRYFMTYYAIDAVNFTPADLSSALNELDAPYLPLVVQEAAGVPLDQAFAEQRNILQRCSGRFFLCTGGAEARRFNRLLIEAGLIKGL